MFKRTLLCSLTLTLGLLINATPASADDIQVGDEVIVRTYSAHLWKGEKVTDSIPRMTYFKVEQVKGKWLRGTFPISLLESYRKKPVTGWIDSKNVIATKGFKKRSLSKRGDLKGLPAHTKIVVMIGDPSPDKNGLFAIFETPIMNDQRQVAFGAALLATEGGHRDDRGVFIGSEKSITQIAREGQVMSGNRKIVELGSGKTRIVSNFNDSGQMAFQAVINAGSRYNAILRGDADGLTVIANTRKPLSVVNGKFARFATFWDNGQVINDQGEVVVWADIADSQTGTTRDVGIFVGDGTTLRQIVRKGQPVPESNRYFTFQNAFLGMATTLNNRGEVVLSVDTSDRPGSLGGAERRIIRSNGHELLKIARRNQKTSQGESFFSLHEPVINHRGHVAFSATLSNMSNVAVKTRAKQTEWGMGIYLHEGKKPFQLKEIVKSGRSAPNGNGRFSGPTVKQINTPSQIVFFTGLLDVQLDRRRTDQLKKYMIWGFKQGGNDPATMAILMASLEASFPMNGLFRSEPASDRITTIVRTGQDSPDGDGIFVGVSNCRLSLNDAGQVAFDAGLTATGGENVHDGGIFFYDDRLGLVVVARTEMPFLGSKISRLHPLAGGRGDDRTCLNAHGQVTFGFQLEDNREGIAIWTPPTDDKP